MCALNQGKLEGKQNTGIGNVTLILLWVARRWAKALGRVEVPGVPLLSAWALVLPALD